LFSSLSFLQSIFFFFFTDPATTEIYTLSLHDALPILAARSLRNRLGTFDARSSFAIRVRSCWGLTPQARRTARAKARGDLKPARSEEHTSELQSRGHLVCRLLLEKKNNITAPR